MKCTLCGFRYDRSDERCHVNCPLAANCQIICCPRCGYQTVDESQGLVGRLVRWLRGRKRRPDVAAGTIPISQATPGTEFEVVEIRPGHPRRLERLSALGIVPTAIIRLRQRHPAPVLEVGLTQVAVDAEIARQIYVRRRP
jgi:Fe2+ transport system protein FeoA